MKIFYLLYIVNVGEYFKQYSNLIRNKYLQQTNIDMINLTYEKQISKTFFTKLKNKILKTTIGR